MYIKDAMVENPFVITKDTKITVALDIMNQNEFHRLPVVDEDGKIIGLITEGIITDNPSNKATSLSVYELNYLFSKTPVEDIMIKDVITIGKDAFLDEAAAFMRQNGIGCLPVVENEKVIGIVTDNDIFDAFANLLGYNVEGSKYIIDIEEDKVGIIESIAMCFVKESVSIATISTYYGSSGIQIIIIANGRNVEEMKKALEDEGFNVAYAALQN